MVPSLLNSTGLMEATEEPEELVRQEQTALQETLAQIRCLTAGVVQAMANAVGPGELAAQEALADLEATPAIYRFLSWPQRFFPQARSHTAVGEEKAAQAVLAARVETEGTAVPQERRQHFVMGETQAQKDRKARTAPTECRALTAWMAQIRIRQSRSRI
jgi:hypothetical protein